MYQILTGGDCDGIPQPAVPNIAETSLHIFTIPEGKGNQAMEAQSQSGTTVDSGVISVDYQTNAGLRFPNILIDKDDTIMNAYLGLQPAESAGNMNSTIVVVSIENTVNSNPFSSAEGSIMDREMAPQKFSTMYVSEAMTQYSYAMFDDATAMVKEIVKRVNWRMGNPLTFILDFMTGAPMKVYSSNSNSGNGPILVVQYLHTGGSPLTPSPFSGNVHPSRDSGSSSGSSGSSGNKDGGDEEDSGMSGGAVAAIVICVLFAVGFIGYFVYNHMQNKNLLTGFTVGNNGFQRFGAQDGHTAI